MIYIHVPFCHRKCTYCAFYSRAVGNRQSVVDYVDSLLEEMRCRKGEQAHPIKTIYFGGGTPSILEISELKRIVEALHECFDLSQVEEVTLEANPEDLTPDYLQGLKKLGLINRLSIGIQSLDDEMLRMLNRRHTAAQAIAAVENAYDIGFHNLSVDFIYGLPLDSHFSDFNFQKVSHVSAYALTVEPGTALAAQLEQGRVALPEEDAVVEQYHILRQRLNTVGFNQYEISNYARPGFESKHNSRYWDRTPYLGLGPGAHSFTIFAGDSTSVAHSEKRRWNKPDGTVEEEVLSDADACNEILMTSLRTVHGFSLSQLPEKYREKLCQEVQPYVDCGWIEAKSEYGDMRYKPTPEGLLHADGIAAALFV